jgi:tripartite-type tricarboxylate transporter receptor subunit TctC
VRKVNADLLKAMHDPDIRKRLADLGRDDRPMTPAELSAFIQSEQKKWGPIEQQIAAQTQKRP